MVKSDSEGWYILFYVWNVQKNKLERKRKFIPSNYTTNNSKESFAKDFIKKINLLLSEGYHINANKASNSIQKSKVNTSELSISQIIANTGKSDHLIPEESEQCKPSCKLCPITCVNIINFG